MSIIWAGSRAKIARIFQNGFAMTISATARKRDKLAAQLTWLANRHILGLPEDRRHGRIVPRNPVGRLILPNGVNVSCRIIDVSQSGAGIASDQRPPIGALVTWARCKAASCVISKTASPSSSPGCSIPISRRRYQRRLNIRSPLRRTFTHASGRQKTCDHRLEDIEPLDLRNVTAILDDFDAGIGDALGELLGVDRRDQRVILAPDNQGIGLDTVDPLLQALVGYRPDELSGRAERPDQIGDEHRRFLGIVRHLDRFLHRLQSRCLYNVANNFSGGISIYGATGASSRHKPMGSSSTILLIRSGRCAASSHAIIPPNDVPTTGTDDTLRASRISS